MDIQSFSDSPDIDESSPPSPPRRILFPLGQIVATPGALELLSRHSLSPMTFIERHVSGDGGCLCPEDVLENQRAVKYGYRVFSSYEIPGGERQIQLEALGQLRRIIKRRGVSKDVLL